jgi:hypothetical protein
MYGSDNIVINVLYAMYAAIIYQHMRACSGMLQVMMLMTTSASIVNSCPTLGIYWIDYTTTTALHAYLLECCCSSQQLIIRRLLIQPQAVT